MKQRRFFLLFLCTFFLTACGNHSESAEITTASPWPSHAPEATPYVRLQSETNGLPSPESEQGQTEHEESYENFIRSVFAEEGNYYGKNWELQMFKDLPQDEPYPFVVRTNAMLQGADTVEDHIALAKKFAELGCDAKVKEMRSVEDGKEYLAWVTIITTTPSHLWELSDSLEEQLHVEQLYQSVDIRFDTVVWPEE
ncbi:MAG: hypothetical protein IJH70_04610 [Oscillospiraceae bacterium]|nr:hypothetical protein [Oscillospiraceae bacterium]